MKIAYYMPFKPLGHPNPSGDLMIGTELHDYFQRKHHAIRLMSRLRCRWIYRKPFLWPKLIGERKNIHSQCHHFRPDLWLSYHTYYKSPDLLGPSCSKHLKIPYVIFQGIYSTKRRRKLKTLPGFLLNRLALRSAHMVFTNKHHDENNLRRLLPENRVVYIPPGIHPKDFTFSASARMKLHRQWQIQGQKVIMTAAMFRPGVKTDGIIQVIEACHHLKKHGHDIFLTILGDGTTRPLLEMMAAEKLSNSVRFLGKIPRQEMYKYYSSADLFAFPGIEESLGMVYLEAQSCRLPVVAFEDWGAREAVINNGTGLLSPAKTPSSFAMNIQELIVNQERCKKMGRQAQHHIRSKHDLEHNYSQLENILNSLLDSA